MLFRSFFSDAPAGKIFSGSAKSLQPQVLGPHAGDIGNAVGNALVSIEQGKAKPDEVLTAAKGGYSSIAQLNQQLFYAQLYVGLFYEASGNEKLARKHITQAAEEYKADDYMGDVARVHSELLKKNRS